VLYDLLYKTVLTRIDPELIHDVCLDAIEITGKVPLVRDVVRQMWGRRPVFPVPSANQGGPFARPVPGILGLAAGMDKEGQAVEGLDMLGFGFIEVGTFTAHPQGGNDKPRMWRYPQMRAVRNRMGFNNSGADEAAKRLRALRRTPRGRSIVVGANIGKTKVTPLEEAVEDYRYSAAAVARWVDYLVVNVSSPNTPGLRTLQSIATLRPLLQAVREEANRVSPHRHVPLTVKIAPDLVDEDITAVARLAQELKLDGIIATNTTIAREGLGLHTTKEKINAIGAGGLSGEPLKTRSLEVLHLLKKEIGNKLALISVGGVTNAQDVQERLDAGADLVQGYTAFLYEGPLWAAHINRGLYKIRRSRQK